MVRIVPTAISDLNRCIHNATGNGLTPYDKQFIYRAAGAAFLIFAYTQNYGWLALMGTALSVPVTTLTAGAALAYYGAVTCKVAFTASSIFDAAAGISLFASSWYLLHNYQNFQGLVDGTHSLVSQVRDYFTS